MIKLIWIDTNELEEQVLLEKVLVILPEVYLVQASKFVCKIDRYNFILGKLLVAYCFKSIYDEDIDWSKMCFSDSMKPIYNGKFNFNISHSGSITACVFSDKIEVGFDVQQILPIEFLEYEFALNENEYAAVKGSISPLRTFYMYWTLKESVLKLTGEGLLGDFKGFKFGSIFENHVLATYKNSNKYIEKIKFNGIENYLGAIATNQLLESGVPVQQLKMEDLFLNVFI